MIKRPRRGTFVTEVTPQSVVEIYTLRVLLEGYAAAIAAANCQSEIVDRMRGLVAKMEDSMREADFVGFSEADLEFHNLLCSSTKHSHLIYLSQCLRMEMGFHVVLSRYSLAETKSLVQEHRLLLEAIEAGESEEARSIARRHIRVAGQLFLQKFFDLNELPASEQDREKLNRFWKAVD